METNEPHYHTNRTDLISDEHKPAGGKSQQEEKNTVFLRKTLLLEDQFHFIKTFLFLKEEAKMQLEEKA